MSAFDYQGGVLHAEARSVARLAEEFGTPLYVYSQAAVLDSVQAFEQALSGLPHQICYAVKANDHLAILRLLAERGCGFDIVSGGELQRVLRAGGLPERIVFSGVGKRREEIEQALAAGIACFNVESEAELQRIAEIAAAQGVAAPVSLRVNPDVDAGTHPYISTGLRENKFGITVDEAERLYRQAADNPALEVVGIDCHIGSQLTRTAPFVAALERVLALVDRLAAAGVTFRHLDIGGGLGIRYQDETPPSAGEYVDALKPLLAGRDLTLYLEPGRAIVGNAGLLLTRVEYLKHGELHDFAVVDAAMTELLRPALYQAWHDIRPVAPREGEARVYDIVGPVCETGDFLGKQRSLVLAEGDLLAVMSAGAYAATMGFNYNSRPRPAAVLVDGDNARLIRRRESVDDLLRDEIMDG